MLSTRILGPLLGCIALQLNVTTCRSPGESDKAPPSETSQPPKEVRLDGVDTADLTAREKAQWSGLVSTLLSPCSNVPVPVHECVQQKRDCKACLPAAKYLLKEVKQGRSKAQAELAYQARFAADQVKNISIEGSPQKGATDATITLVEFADFECPACKAATPVLDALVEKNADVRLVFKNFPLDFHEHAEDAARASMAADEQGKFWDMHKALFKEAEPLTLVKLSSLAKTLGLSAEQFEKSLRSEVVVDRVARDKKHGKELNLRGTPSVFINGREFSYAADFAQELEAWVALERELLAKKP